QLYRDEIKDKENDFFEKVFISEINYSPSPESRIKNFAADDSSLKIPFRNERIRFLKQPFFKSFPVTILACGRYLNDKTIEETFDVSKVDDFTEKRYRFVVYRTEGRVLINTRQLSMTIKSEYFFKIIEQIKKTYQP
ncbi:MAG TPA: hypothetical protein VGB95_03645, partial [Chitinophagales bacterium]